jgi:hypothetical protein
MNQILLGIRTSLISITLLRNYIGLACLTLLPVILFFSPLERPLYLQDVEFFGFTIDGMAIGSLTMFSYNLMRNIWTLGAVTYLFAIWSHTKISFNSLVRTIMSHSTTLLIWSGILGLVDFYLGALFHAWKESAVIILISVLQFAFLAAWQLSDFLLIPRLADRKDSFLPAMRWVWATIAKRPLLILSCLISLFCIAGLLYAPIIPKLLNQAIPGFEPDTFSFLLNLLISPWIMTATILLAAMIYRTVVSEQSETVRFTHMSSWQLFGRAIITLCAVLIIAITITGLITFAIARAR